MEEPITGEQKTTDGATPTMQLADAVRIVRDAIAAEEARLRQIADGTEYEHILLEGETCEGYDARILANPAKVARILLDYDYPLYKILEMEWQPEMWDALAQMVGVYCISAVDM